MCCLFFPSAFVKVSSISNVFALFLIPGKLQLPQDLMLSFLILKFLNFIYLHSQNLSILRFLKSEFSILFSIASFCFIYFFYIIYWFPIADKINYHKISGLKQYKCITLIYASQISEMGFTVSTSKCWQDYQPSGGSRGYLFPYLFQLLEATCIFGSWLPPLPSKLAVYHLDWLVQLLQYHPTTGRVSSLIPGHCTSLG